MITEAEVVITTEVAEEITAEATEVTTEETTEVVVVVISEAAIEAAGKSEPAVAMLKSTSAVVLQLHLTHKATNEYGVVK